MTCGQAARKARSRGAVAGPQRCSPARAPGGPRTVPALPGLVPRGLRREHSQQRRSGRSRHRTPPRPASSPPGRRQAHPRPQPACRAARPVAASPHGAPAPRTPPNDHPRSGGRSAEAGVGLILCSLNHAPLEVDATFRIVKRAGGWLSRLVPERSAWQDADVPVLWIAHLLISDRTAEKIINVHGIHPDDVRDAVVCVPGLRFSWDTRRDRGAQGHR
jgi:hypothetical protein